MLCRQSRWLVKPQPRYFRCYAHVQPLKQQVVMSQNPSEWQKREWQLSVRCDQAQRSTIEVHWRRSTNVSRNMQPHKLASFIPKVSSGTRNLNGSGSMARSLFIASSRLLRAWDQSKASALLRRSLKTLFWFADSGSASRFLSLCLHENMQV